jgi:hypothetical protein
VCSGYRAKDIMVRVRHYTKISLLVIMLLQGILVRSGLADCRVNGVPGSGGTAGDDTIVCDNDPAPPAPTVVGGGAAGNDTITIDSDNHALISGDGTVGGGTLSSVGVAGNDTITVNGNTAAHVYGDLMNGNVNGGADTIIINGTATSVQGDVIARNATGGADTIIINGTVTDVVTGDTHSYAIAGNLAVGGNDTIIVNGTVGNTVDGDWFRFSTGGTRVGGNDTIIINSTAQVNGNVTGETDATIGGDDTITIEVGATVLGTISGGNVAGDFDTLTFTGSTSDQAGYAQLQALVGCNPCNGTVTIDGYTYTFTNFEQFVNLMTLIVALPNAQVIITFNPPPDDRINWQEGDWLTPIYNHNGDVRGILALGPADDLWIPETELPTGIPAENTLVGCNVSNTVCLYQLAGNGYWQVNANLVVDGLPQLVTVIFDSLNPTTVTSS